MSNKKVNFTLQLPEPLFKHFRQEAKKRMTSAGAVVREILAGHVEDQKKGGK